MFCSLATNWLFLFSQPNRYPFRAVFQLFECLLQFGCCFPSFFRPQSLPSLLNPSGGFGVGIEIAAFSDPSFAAVSVGGYPVVFMNSAPELIFIFDLTRQYLQDLWLACCEARKHKRYRMETPTGWPVQNLARMRSALWRLEELEKRLGQALLGRECKHCGANLLGPFYGSQWADSANALRALRARACCEMSASASRRDNTDRSLARSAWESVPRKNRPVGYGMIGRS